MTSSFYIFTGIFFLILTLLVAYAAFYYFRLFKRLNNVLNSALDMNASTSGTISSLSEVCRGNQTNEYPIITYTVDGKPYTASLYYAAKKKGYYNLGGDYHVCYTPSDPSRCIVDEFRKPLTSFSTPTLIAAIIISFFALNLLVLGSIVPIIKAF